jgi:GAF domain-containing protein
MHEDPLSFFQTMMTEAKEPGDLQDALTRIASAAKKQFSADFCVIFPMNPITRTFLREKPIVIGEVTEATLKEILVPRENGLASLVITNRILLVGEEQLPNYRTIITDLEKICAFVAFGLYTPHHKRPLAVIYLDYKKRKQFDEKYQSALHTFIEFGSAELKNTWFVRRYRDIAKIGQEVNENLDNLECVFDRVFEHIKGIVDVGNYFSFANYDIQRNNVDLYLVDKGIKEIRKDESIIDTPTAWVIQNMKTLQINNLDTDILPEGVIPKRVGRKKPLEKSLLFVPLKLKNRPMGVISVQHLDPYHYTDEDKQILELLANHMSLALNNIRLLEDLKQLDSSGQILVQKLDESREILDEVVDFIHRTTRSDTVVLFPYLQSENRFLSPVIKGNFNDPGSLKLVSNDPDSIVRQLYFLEKPIFAEDSTSIYEQLGISNHEKKFIGREGIRSTVAIPLRVGVEPIGVLFVNYRTRQIFDRAQQWVTTSLATYAAIAIRNSRQLQEERNLRINELQAVRKIDRAISQILDRDRILQTIVELTTEHVKADIGIILLYNKKTNSVEAKASAGGNIPPLEQQVYSLDKFEGIAKTAFERKQTIRIDNVNEDVEWKNKYIPISDKTISEMDVPLLLRDDFTGEDEVIGVMNFESARKAAFSADDQYFMETLAGQAVIAIKNAVEYERAQRIAKERAALIDIVNKLLLKTEPKEIFSIILGKALEITETSYGSISTCNEERREIKIVAQKGIEDIEWLEGVRPFDVGIIGKVAREKCYLKIDNLLDNPLLADYRSVFPAQMASELAVPILEGKKITGVINLENEHPYHFEDDDIELVKSLASLCAVSLKTVQTIHEKELAWVGTITGDISHKMNSPLSMIRRLIELLDMNCSNELENAYLAEKIKKIDLIALETTQMVRKLIEEAKRSFTTVEKTSLKFVFPKAVSHITIPDNIILSDEISTAEASLDVLATPELTNIFHNLILNAIQAMPRGGHLRVLLDEVSDDWIQISIEDTGKGIPPHMAPMVYLPISEQGIEGHGFGLPLTKAYIEMIGGRIDDPVEGKDGIGARFTIHLRKAA